MLLTIWKWLLKTLIGVLEKKDKLKKVTTDDILMTLSNHIGDHYEKDVYIQGRFLNTVLYLVTREAQNSFLYNFVLIALVILSASTTLIVGLEAIFATSTALKIIALLSTLSVTVLSTILTTFNFETKSIAFRNHRETLIAEFYKFHERMIPYHIDGDRKNSFVTKIEAIIEEANRTMGESQTKKPDTNTVS